MRDVEKRLSHLEAHTARPAYRAALDPFTRAVLDKVATGVPVTQLTDAELDAASALGPDLSYLSDAQLDALIARARGRTG